MDSTEPTTRDLALARLGFTAGQVIQEFGYDEDVDNDVRFALEDLVGGELVDEDQRDVVDGALIWWRADDGDLVDTLTDALPNLTDGGFLVLLTRKPGRDGAVEMSDIEESAVVAGLHSAGVANLSEDWVATRLVPARTTRH